MADTSPEVIRAVQQWRVGFVRVCQRLGTLQPPRGADALQKSGDKDHNYLRDGFYARTLAQEKRCLDLGLNVLMEIEDVTERVSAAVKPEMSAEQAHARIAKARFALEGTGQYPDATFTLRLAFGTVRGYQEDGQQVPFETTLAGLYQRAADQRYKPPFDLPARWVKAKGRLDLKTPFNFVSTADIIGGNSGSPVVNRKGEFVGIIFDGNIQSLVLDFGYTDDQARAVSVHSRAIIEALRKVYGAKDLAEELVGKRRKD